MALRPRTGAAPVHDSSPAEAHGERVSSAAQPAAMNAAPASLVGDEAAHAAARHRADQAEQLAATVARVGAARDVAGALEALLRGAMAVLGGQHGVVRLFGPAPGKPPVELI